MPALLRKLLISIPVFLVSSMACWAQTTMIEGDVKGVDGKGVPAAVIKIERTDVKNTYTVKTDKKGHYIHAGLPIGAYKVSVEVDGQQKDAINGVRTKLGDPTEVNFDLKAAAAASAASTAAGAPPVADATRGMSATEKAEYERKLKEQADQLNKNKALNDAFNAGKEAAAAKNWDVAIDSFQKASEIPPPQHVVFANLADAYENRAGVKTGAEQAADLDKASDNYKKAIELKPDESAYHNNFALALAKAKKFDEAQAELAKAAQLDPPSAGKYNYNLGAVLVNTGQMEAAGAAFKRAIDADPNYADAHYQYAIYLLGKATVGADGKVSPPAGTEDELQKYLQLAPTGPFADSSKAMLESFGATVQTQFSKGGQKSAPAPAPAKKKN